MTPRPILKSRLSYDYFPSPSTALPFKHPHSPHVHFPPTPTLTDTQITHSPFVYDRAPIVVSPNACQLPERGGRAYYHVHSPPIYGSGAGVGAGVGVGVGVSGWHGFSTWSNADAPVSGLEMGPVKGSYFHPRAFEACELEHFDDEQPPPLIPDISSSSSSSTSSSSSSSSSSGSSSSSESEDSSPVQSPTPMKGLASPPCMKDEVALSFLPHPHTHTRFQSSSKEQEQSPQHSPSPPPPPPPPPRRPKLQRKKTPRRIPPRLDDLKEGFTEANNTHLSLDGCLGGF